MSRSRSQRRVARQHLGQEHRCCLRCLRMYTSEDCSLLNTQLNKHTVHPLLYAENVAGLLHSRPTSDQMLIEAQR